MGVCDFNAAGLMCLLRFDMMGRNLLCSDFSVIIFVMVVFYLILFENVQIRI